MTARGYNDINKYMLSSQSKLTAKHMRGSWRRSVMRCEAIDVVVI